MSAPPAAIRRACRSESGQALVEFAMILPFLAFLLFGIVDFATAMSHWNDVNHVAAAGARNVAVNKDTGGGDMQAWIKSSADSALVRDTAVVRIEQCEGDIIGGPVKVTVSVSYPFLRILNLGTAEISGSATMRMEARATNYTPDATSC